MGKIGLYPPDAYSGTHLFGSFFLVKVIGHWVPDVWIAAGCALLLGIAWELVVDALKFDPLFPDTRGADVGDVVADAIGCLLAVWI